MFKKAIFSLMLILCVFAFTGAAFASGGVTHTVTKGEYLWLLGITYGVPVQEVIEANQLVNPELIYPGQKIWIPQAKAKTDPQQQISRGSSRFAWADIELMARVVMAESQGEPYKGQVGVAAVLLNRLYSPKFPNSLSDVIYQPGAFQPVDNGSLWWGYPSQTAFDAVQEALNGNDPTGGALYFGTSNSWYIWQRTVTARIGNHIFAR